MTDAELIARLDHWIEQQVLVLVDSDLLPIRARIEALTKERDQWISHAKNAIWADSEELKEAEAYAEELEDKLSICERHRDAYAECDRIGTQAVCDLEAKLAKAVEALERIAGVKGPYSHPFPESYEGYGAFAIVTSRETLEEIKGESHE